jgi:hypothetical protein
METGRDWLAFTVCARGDHKRHKWHPSARSNKCISTYHCVTRMTTFKECILPKFFGINAQVWAGLRWELSWPVPAPRPEGLKQVLAHLLTRRNGVLVVPVGKKVS